MATRTIADPRDRLVTIALAPLMTCSARLPVYALLIAAFVPEREAFAVAGVGVGLQGLVLFALYVAGLAGAAGVAWALKHFTRRGDLRTLMMELPSWHWPHLPNVLLGLWQRVLIFLKRVGGIILVMTIAIWFLASFPAPPEGFTGPAIQYSLAGVLGRALELVFAPIGFNWQICIALVPGMAAREVAVSALGTVYALSATGDGTADALVPLIASQWSLATALALMAWFVFAPQCLSTLATIKRETGGWRMPLVVTGYLFVLAYAAAGATYHLARMLGAS
jgi:ferrous iron transport protein B